MFTTNIRQTTTTKSNYKLFPQLSAYQWIVHTAVTKIMSRLNLTFAHLFQVVTSRIVHTEKSFNDKFAINVTQTVFTMVSYFVIIRIWKNVYWPIHNQIINSCIKQALLKWSQLLSIIITQKKLRGYANTKQI